MITRCLTFLVFLLLMATSLAGQTPKFELLLGGVLLDARENRVVGTGVPENANRGEGKLAGGEILVRARTIGLAGRYLVGDMEQTRGNFVPGRLHIADARLILGPQAFAVEAGGMYRKMATDSTPRQWFYGRLGARSTFFIGASGVAVTLAGAYYLYVYEDTEETGGRGWEGETSVRYSRRGIPIYVQLGYRYQSFQPKTKNQSPQSEISGLSLGGGIRLASH